MSDDNENHENDEESLYTQEQKRLISELEAGPMRAELKYLDKRQSEKGQIYYTDTKDEETPEQTNWWQQYALCLTRTMSEDGKKVRGTALQVNSEHLKKLLRGQIDNYPGVSFHTKNISISAPYHVLYHYRSELKEASRKLKTDSEAANHFKLLEDFIEETFQDEIAEHENLFPQGLVTYGSLWTLFRPGTMLFSSMLTQMRAFKLNTYFYACGDQPAFCLNSAYIDYDGEEFGTRETQRRIPPFVGAAPITDLEAVPVHLHKAGDSIRTALIARGASFEKYAGMNFLNYTGTTLDMEDPCKIKRVSVDGRVVIDCKTFHRFNPDQEFYVSRLSSKSSETQRNETRFGQDDNDTPDPVKLTPDQLLITTGLVRGFAFGEKRWLDFFVEKLSPIQWNEKCFDQLVLAQSHKNIVRAIVSDHLQVNDTYDDIVEGKGKGLVMVLHGPPGVGKTLTAECVSEFVKRPLYIVSSGDLGTDSGTLDERLTEILDMAQTWRVVLLIDEADVFLEERSQHDLERNALVSIFLRVLEYYAGIMFLTTNRVDTFDDAFKSRIHVPLKYSDLTQASRKQIWKNFLGKVDEGVEVDDAGYDALSSAELNGRQIKNIIRTAKSLAHYDSKKLDLDMLQQVIGIQLEFERDLDLKSGKAVNGHVDAVVKNGVNGVA